MSENKTIRAFEEYQEATEATVIYPDEIPEWINGGLVYAVLELDDEAGEVVGKLKKAIREDDPSYLDDMEDELGDVLWPLARVCEELAGCERAAFDGDLGDVAQANIDKLLDRQDRGVLEGEGDDR